MTKSFTAKSMLPEAWWRGWIVPPLVVPIALGLMIAAVALYRVTG
jgi:hypothetical protein